MITALDLAVQTGWMLARCHTYNQGTAAHNSHLVAANRQEWLTLITVGDSGADPAEDASWSSTAMVASCRQPDGITRAGMVEREGDSRS